MDKIRWIIFGVVCAAIVVGLVVFSNKDRVNVDGIDSNKIVTDTSNGAIPDHVFGNKDAKVVVVEYADFQCPGCAGAYKNVVTIKNKYQSDVAFVFRNFPITSAHPHAYAAASAAEAAGLQNKYWEMHDLIFSTRDTWNTYTGEQRTKLFESYATQIGLNLDQFRTDIVSKKVVDKIARDRSLALKAKVESTPTFIVAGEKSNVETTDNVIRGDGTKFTAMIDATLKKAGVTPTAQ